VTRSAAHCFHELMLIHFIAATSRVARKADRSEHYVTCVTSEIGDDDDDGLCARSGVDRYGSAAAVRLGFADTDAAVRQTWLYFPAILILFTVERHTTVLQRPA
jgi:hypothetical protein